METKQPTKLDVIKRFLEASNEGEIFCIENKFWDFEHKEKSTDYYPVWEKPTKREKARQDYRGYWYEPGNPIFYQTVRFVVVPRKVSYFTQDELNRFMKRMIPPHLKPDYVNKFSEEYNRLRLGWLEFSEKVGEVEISKKAVVTFKDQSLLEELAEGFEIIDRRLTREIVNETKPYIRYIEIHPYPNKEFIEEFLGGKLGVLFFSQINKIGAISLEEIDKFRKPQQYQQKLFLPDVELQLFFKQAEEYYKKEGLPISYIKSLKKEILEAQELRQKLLEML